VKCRCCNIEMLWREFRMLQDDGSEEDMCSSCLNIVYYPEYCEPPHYAFSDITEMAVPFIVTPPKKVEY